MSEKATSGLGLSPAWWQCGLARITWCWPIKFFGSLLFSAGFFTGYFLLLKHPIFPVFVMPTTTLDRWAAFVPQTVWIYGSLWLYLQLAPALLSTQREIWSYGVALTAMTAVAFACFLVFPTRVPAFPLDWANHPGFSLLKKTDAGGNACPSLHVAFATFTALWIARLLRTIAAPKWVQILNWAWAICIAYSTLSTRQHVALDVYAGALLGLLTAAFHFRWLGGRAARDRLEFRGEPEAEIELREN